MPAGSYAANDKALPSSGLELNILAATASAAQGADGQPHDFRGDVASVAKRALRAGRDARRQKAAYGVGGKTEPAAAKPEGWRAAIGLGIGGSCKERHRAWRGECDGATSR